MWQMYQKNYQPKREYLDHLTELGKHYLNTPGVKNIRLRTSSKNYLKGIYRQIIKSNEIYLKEDKSPEFFIIKDQAPFIFSLPGAKFYISTSLLEKYLKNESLMIAAIGTQVVKSSLNVYDDRRTVPVGYIGTGKIISLTKVSLKIKNEINKWTFISLKRANFDATAILNWIQTKNKNIIDFTYMVGTQKQSTEEEFLFKNFLVQDSKNIFEEVSFENSSKGFYNLVRDVRRSLN